MQAQALSPSASESMNGTLETLARTYVAAGEWTEATAILERLEEAFTSETDRLLYPNRYAMLTKVDILMRRADWGAAHRVARELVEISELVGDHSLRIIATARYAVAASSIGENTKANELLDEVGKLLVDNYSPRHVAEYEFALAKILAEQSHEASSQSHELRAARIYKALNCVWQGPPHETDGPVPCLAGAGIHEAVHEIASLLLHAGRPELVAVGLLRVAETEGYAKYGRATKVSKHHERQLGEFGGLESSTPRRFRVGASGSGESVTLELSEPLSAEDQSCLNSLSFILSATQELAQARAQREERMTLWPMDELPAVDDESIVTGRLREFMLAVRKIADAKVTVLITGESGTGKEVIARALHRYSHRATKPFVALNCTAVPRDLMESHLFGFRRGAFTGADRDNLGLFRSAKDGTIFLDEIGDLNLDLQPKLLRVLETSQVNPLGDAATVPVNVRIVAATNANLKRMVEQGRFREDLYYRLNVYPIQIPPLRERREEIAPLAQFFAGKWSYEFRGKPTTVSPELMAHLELHPWPGNIRQLSNEINRMVAQADSGEPLTLKHLTPEMKEQIEEVRTKADGQEITLPLTGTLQDAVDTLERQMIELALKLHNGKLEDAAKALGLSRKGLYLKRQRLGL
ncbi:MAG: sigma-54-dependent Fis family transcriptional regulator [Acidobacteria bacterium]|nr:sigma-54-dependent Fis family transcriptional regulator [Acidobacteriota bacterium]